MHFLTALRPLAVITGAILAALVLNRIAEAVVGRLTARRPDTPLWVLLRRCRMPFLLTLVSTIALLGEPGAGLAEGLRGPARHMLVLAAIMSSSWLVARVIALTIDLSLNSYATGPRDPARIRRVRTQADLMRRISGAATAVVAIAAMLLTFPGVRTVGASLLASAGLIGLVAGVAAQSTLANLFAGLQLAFGDMVRIGDSVVVAGDWGTVEEITLTYVVIATWDQRRIVMPVSYFAGKPFENWSRNDPSMTGTVLLHLDHTTPVEPLRAEFLALLRKSELWDGRGQALQVVDTTPSTIVVRALMTARDAPEAFDLRCWIREGLIAFLRDHHPQALPRVAVGRGPEQPADAAPPRDRAPS
ncbi:mechanosensitive ion channel family protein [Streptacidiphilus carbonis]|uniref:mechanosensitive ion channel family protein n=1 Tax=Streptacidiphilus carbonis TaxID=105422 RepID=UPI000AACC468|nr:mechanosensitive ion channel domain-containing protein [Streptacidiphilus carbonis]